MRYTVLILCLLALLVLLCTPAHAQQADNRMCLLVAYDQGETSRQMMPVLKRLMQAGYDLRFIDVLKPANKPYLEWFDFSGQAPHYVVYAGHEALEQANGTMTAAALAQWHNQVARGEATGRAKVQGQRGYLKNAPENMTYLRRVIDPPSCGMLWCAVHAGGPVLETLDASGNILSRQKEYR